MKKFFAGIALFMSCAATTYAQVNVAKPKLSPLTRQYLLECKKQQEKQGLVPDFVYKKIGSKAYMSAMIKVNADIDEATLSALGIYTGTKAGNIWTVQIPVENMLAFTTTPGINYISLDAPVFPLMDSARKQTRADSAQKGINLPMPVTGKNVVVGVIDAGFDYNHPTMYDTLKKHYRVKKVWNQKRNDIPPPGYAYGNEMTDTNVIKNTYDTAITSHGAHVAGIAAGSGYGSSNNNSRYRGMAYESDMVLVGIMPDPSQWIVAGESDIVDGMSYIFDYATSTGQPAVVNLSWGSTLGPHDGNSLFNQACDALTGPGKIFVCAAGNNGQDTVHLRKAFSAADTTVSTFVTFSPYLDTNKLATWVDVWGDSGKTFCVNVRLFNGPTAIASTGYVCTADTTVDLYLVGSNGDSCFVTIITTAAEYNDKPHAFIKFRSKVRDNICLTTKATSGVVNMWEGYILPPTGYYGYLKKLGYPFAISGDANMTVSDIGCTRSAITAGAYTSKAFFTNTSGATLSYPGANRGRIAPFSSFGPTSDNRVKPDITAPGFALASAVSSYDSSFYPGGDSYNAVVSADTDDVSGRIYKYAVLAGTSMASPCVAGIVAMMLQVNPSLTPEETKTIIKNTAIKDIYTGTIPGAGNNTWGHGKINAYKAVSYLVQKQSVSSVNMDPMDCILYPNPNNGGFTIAYTSKTNEELMIEVFDVAGKLMGTQQWTVNKGSNVKLFNGIPFSKGIYFTKVSAQKGHNVIKMVVE